MAESYKTDKLPYESVRQIDGDGSPVPPHVYQPRTKLEKLGKKNALVLILGSLVLLLAVAFLAFLWYVAIERAYTGKNVPRLWFAIIEANWQATMVTTASTVIRAAITAQLCCFAAIMAALILEKKGAGPKHFPSLSIIRYSNSGPKSLISHVWHNKSKACQRGYSALIILAILNALILQFASTILLRDFYRAPVSFGELKEIYPWGLTSGAKTDSVMKGNDFWRAGQTVMPPFAEYRESWSINSTSSDTGKTYRGFLPIVNQTIRDQLSFYQGPMTIVDERVVCVKPTISNITLNAIQTSESQQDEAFTLGGNININNTHRDVVQGNGKNSFNCTLPTPGYELGLWPVAICSLGQGLARLKGGIVEESTDLIDSDGLVDTGTTGAWLFLNLTATGDFNYTDWQRPTMEGASMPLDQGDSADGPWARFEHNNTSISLSVCLFNPQIDVYEAAADGRTDYWYEVNTIFWNSTSSIYNTNTARYQLGAMRGEELKYWNEHWLTVFGLTNDTKNEDLARGALFLQNPANWTANKSSTMYNVTLSHWMDDALKKVKPSEVGLNQEGNDVFQLTPFGDDYDTIHKSYQAVAQDVFQHTDDPALTLQTLTHMVLQTAYYDWLPNFDINGTSAFFFIETRNLPASWAHFTAIMSLLGLHLLLLIIASILFLATAEMSLLGNAWQTVAQVHSHDTADTIHRAHMATDDELTAGEKNPELSDAHIMIRRSERNGRHEAAIVSPAIPARNDFAA